MAVVLVAIVAAARLGPSEPLPEVTAPPTADRLHYLDGIPTFVGNERVLRVRDALRLSVGRTLLVGGWHLRVECQHATRPQRCPLPTLSDVAVHTEARGGLATDWIAMDMRPERNGARIVRAVIEDDLRCSIRRAGDCQTRLRVLQTVWSAELSEPASELSTPQPRASERP